MAIELLHLGADHLNEIWKLERADSRLTLRDTEGETVTSFPIQDAPEHLVLPELTEEHTVLTFLTDDGEHVLQATPRGSLKLRHALAGDGEPDPGLAVARVGRNAGLSLLGGVGLMAAGIIATIVSMMNPESGGVVWYGAVIVGLFGTGYGVMRFFDYRQLKRLFDEVVADSATAFEEAIPADMRVVTETPSKGSVFGGILMVIAFCIVVAVVLCVILVLLLPN